MPIMKYEMHEPQHLDGTANDPKGATVDFLKVHISWQLVTTLLGPIVEDRPLIFFFFFEI